ncbi:hypothetical protein CPB84DRAFT_1782868 [Gymnopilus junonius]|uniref:Uncharacterized protein n=1 Tax=Gymnopilus junonius TaxID=109634 RepID=A0A9P5TLN8_GYMJU|nr:hypothetical protein CPB84DRAFT_1782868 [Gymnopilus junonius]
MLSHVRPSEFKRAYSHLACTPRSFPTLFIYSLPAVPPFHPFSSLFCACSPPHCCDAVPFLATLF